MELKENLSDFEFDAILSGVEIWKGIEYFPNYMVSTFGRVMNIETGRILKPADNGHGYLFVNLYNETGVYHPKIHKLVANTFLDKKNFQSVDADDAFATTNGFESYDKLDVNHKDYNRYNNNVSNLEWSTRLYNNRYSHLGAKRSEEVCKKMSEAQKGHKVSEETRKKMSEARKRYWQGKRLIEDGLMVIEESLNLLDEAITVDDDAIVTVDEDTETLEIKF